MVVVGDNESNNHHYGWYKKSKALWIMQGFSYGLKFQNAGVSTFTVLKVENSTVDVDVEVIELEKPFSELYEINPARIRHTWKKKSIIERIIKRIKEKL